MARGEGVKRIRDLFAGYKGRFVPPRKTVVEALKEVIFDLYQFELKDEHIAYTPSTKIITLSAPGPLKTEIRLRKEEVLVHLKGRLGEKHAPSDII